MLSRGPGRVIALDLSPAQLACVELRVAAYRELSHPELLEFLAAGDSVDDVLDEYPRLTRKDVQACLDYAASVMGNHFSIVKAA